MAVFIGLGTNLGDRERNLQKAINFLSLHDDIQLISQSSYLENPAIEGAGPNDFLNAVIKIETSLSPGELLLYLQKIELALGRKRTKTQGELKQARIIDLDILVFDDLIIESESLIVPHPKMHERDFVMKPLLEIEPSFDMMLGAA